MKKIFLIIFAFAFVFSNAQTADEIIQKYNIAMGGLDNFNKLKAVKMTGTVTTQGLDLPMTVQVINHKAMRTDVDVMGQKIVNCYKDGKGWKINPFEGVTVATDVTGNELSDFKSQSMLANQLMDYKNRGHQVELTGQEDVEGIKTHKIKLTNKDDGDITFYFINASDFHLVKTINKLEIQGMEMEMDTWYSDLREFGGLKLYMHRTQTIEGQTFTEIKYNTIELNPVIDEKIFEKE